MPRPPRCRRICGVPQVDTFCPNGCENTEPILLTLDEYEVIRLVDLEQQTHEQCAAQMDISRSTVQEIYESARRKIAACLVHGKPLHITGGNYRICGGQEAAHCGRCCRMQRANMEKSGKTCKGDSIMKIAVTYESGQIFQHFGHTEQFKLYEAADGTGDRLTGNPAGSQPVSRGVGAIRAPAQQDCTAHLDAFPRCLQYQYTQADGSL